jgi:uncharacterized protein YwgA
VQLQKLFFLLDRNIGDHLGGTYFNFEPYHYGPFDRTVYLEIEKLVNKGLCAVTVNGNVKKYYLTVEGQKAGDYVSHTIEESLFEYMKDVNSYVRRLSFQNLIKAVYEVYPEMKAKSVFYE